MSQESSIYKNLLTRLEFPDSRYLGQILEELVTPSQAELLLELPGSAGQLAAKVQRSEKTVTEQLEDMIRKGLVIPREKNGETTYHVVKSVLQFHDSSGIYEAGGERLLDLWRQWRETEVYELCREWERMPIPMARVFPLRNAVRDDEELLPYEDLHAIIKGAREIAVVNCVCRFLLRRCDKPLEVCLTFDRAAEYALRRGAGRKITTEEALEILDLCEEEGMVPSNLNNSRVTAMCFCCSDCCIFLQPLLDYGYRLLSPSRFQAEVDHLLCIGCGKCVERCPFQAIAMETDDSSGEERPVVDQQKCYGCGACVIKCPSDALTLRLVRPPEHIPQKGFRY